MPIITDESTGRARQLCNQLAIHRIARGLTQRDLAAHFNDRQGNLQEIEVMRRAPTLPRFVSYAWALGLEVGLVPEYHLPLLNLTADELDALRLAAAKYRAIDTRVPALNSALDKLTGSADA